MDDLYLIFVRDVLIFVRRVEQVGVQIEVKMRRQAPHTPWAARHSLELEEIVRVSTLEQLERVTLLLAEEQSTVARYYINPVHRLLFTNIEIEHKNTNPCPPCCFVN